MSRQMHGTTNMLLYVCEDEADFIAVMFFQAIVTQQNKNDQNTVVCPYFTFY